MPMLLEVAVKTVLFGQECMNVMHYASNAPVVLNSANSLELMGFLGWNQFEPNGGNYAPLTVAKAWQDATVSAAVLQSVSIRSVYSDTDMYEWLFPDGGNSATGVYTGEAAAPFMTYGFRSSKVRQSIKRGARRIAGVSETAIGAGGIILPGAKVELNALAAAFSRQYPHAGFFEYLPCIVQKKKEAVLNEQGQPTGRFKYVYWPESEAFDHLAFPVTWDAVDYIRTQTSRQYGRGR